ncbi:MAG: response regulator, partial [Gemmatimonadaceae bacterium]
MSFSNEVRVLVVDDEPTICRALTIALRRAGFGVTAVESGEAAHSLLRAEHFDAMVVDLRIPDLRGDVLFELAASVQPHLKTRTVFTTGDISERAQDLIAACNCPVLAKP